MGVNCVQGLIIPSPAPSVQSIDPMLCSLAKSNRLARLLETLARRRRRGPAEPPSWTGQILSNRGFTRSLAGFICNAVKRGDFLFRSANVRMISRKGWEPGSPEHISWNCYQKLAEEERSDFRIAFRLSLPDTLLHAIVGKFLSAKVERILSDGCFAYRHRLGQPAAVQTVRRFRQDQEKWVVKCDVRSFNETVDHAVLRGILAKRVRPLLKSGELSRARLKHF